MDVLRRNQFMYIAPDKQSTVKRIEFISSSLIAQSAQCPCVTKRVPDNEQRLESFADKKVYEISVRLVVLLKYQSPFYLHVQPTLLN